MKLDFTGRSVVITGSSKGIGLAMAHAFAESGANVAICARGPEPLEQARQALEQHGGKVVAQAFDVRDRAALEGFVHTADEVFDGVDVLVNNVTGHGAVDTEEGWQASFEVDLMALVHAGWAAAPIMEAGGGGAFIHIASINGLRATPRTMPYSTIKAAIVHLTRNQAKQLADRNIRVNCIAPGSTLFEGGFWDEARKTNPDLYGKTLKEMPFGRLGTAGEVANAALFLASDAASWITGQTIAVDGGQSLC